LPADPLQQFLTHDLNITRRLRPDAHLVPLHAQHSDFDPLAGWRLNDDGFAYAAGENEYRASVLATSFEWFLVWSEAV